MALLVYSLISISGSIPLVLAFPNLLRRYVKIDFGVVEFDQETQICRYIEKPTIDYMVSMGIYVFEPRVLSYIPYEKYMDFPDLVKKLLSKGEKVAGYQYDGYWQDLGRPDDYEAATQDFEQMRSRFLPEENQK